MKKMVVLSAMLLLLFSCASHRKKANCSEIRYRLDHMEYNEDQREWIEEEWKLCESEYDSLSKVDQNRYQGIYSQFLDSTRDSSRKDSSQTLETTSDSVSGASLESR